MSDIPPASARRLKMDNPRVVQQYLDLLMDYFTAHAMFSRLRNLLKGVTEGHELTLEQIKECEELDSICTKGCSDPNGYCAAARMTSAHFGESRTKYPLDTHSTIVSLIV